MIYQHSPNVQPFMAHKNVVYVMKANELFQALIDLVHSSRLAAAKQ